MEKATNKIPENLLSEIKTSLDKEVGLETNALNKELYKTNIKDGKIPDEQFSADIMSTIEHVVELIKARPSGFEQKIDRDRENNPKTITIIDKSNGQVVFSTNNEDSIALILKHTIGK